MSTAVQEVAAATDARDTGPSGAPRRPLALAVGGLVAVLVLFGSVLTLALHWGASGTPSAPATGVGASVAGFSIRSVDGAEAVTSPWTHHHAAVVLFFSSWCVPCHAELHRFAGPLGAGDIGGVRFVGIDGDPSARIARTFVSHTTLRIPVGVDPALLISSRLAPQETPAAVFVSARGRVVAVQYGALSDLQLSAGLSLLRHR